jgi:hypothetical protein
VGAEEGGQVLVHDDGLEAALWNRNHFFTVPVPVATFEKVMVPVPTFEK